MVRDSVTRTILRELTILVGGKLSTSIAICEASKMLPLDAPASVPTYIRTIDQQENEGDELKTRVIFTWREEVESLEGEEEARLGREMLRLAAGWDSGLVNQLADKLVSVSALAAKMMRIIASHLEEGGR